MPQKPCEPYSSGRLPVPIQGDNDTSHPDPDTWYLSCEAAGRGNENRHRCPPSYSSRNEAENNQWRYKCTGGDQDNGGLLGDCRPKTPPASCDQHAGNDPSHTQPDEHDPYAAAKSITAIVAVGGGYILGDLYIQNRGIKKKYESMYEPLIPGGPGGQHGQPGTRSASRARDTTRAKAEAVEAVATRARAGSRETEPERKSTKILGAE
jgi:hypothetical protein